MIRVLSTRALHLHSLDTATLKRILDAGAGGVEITANSHLFGSANIELLRNLAIWFADNPLKPWALYAPRCIGEVTEHSGGIPVSLLHADKSRRIESMDEIKRSVESAYLIPFSYLVLPLAQPEDVWSPEIIERGITVLEHLGAFAAQLGMKLLLKAESSEVGQPARLQEILAAGRFRNIHFALDTAEVSIAPGLKNAFESLGDKLKAVYLSDRGGSSILWPGEGTIDWPQVRELVNTLPEDAALVLATTPQTQLTDAALNEKISRAFALAD